jgi:hypothetical protein
MKKLIILVLGLVVLAVLFTMPVWAATEGTISVTVTPKLVSLSVDHDTYDYGVLDLNDTAETAITFNVTNEGNVDEDFDIKGFNTAAWTLAGTAGANEYVHEWKEGVGSYSALSTSNQPAAASVSSDGSKSYQFRLSTPTSSSSFDAQNPNVTFTASES